MDRPLDVTVNYAGVFFGLIGSFLTHLDVSSVMWVYLHPDDRNLRTVREIRDLFGLASGGTSRNGRLLLCNTSNCEGVSG